MFRKMKIKTETAEKSFCRHVTFHQENESLVVLFKKPEWRPHLNFLLFFLKWLDFKERGIPLK